MDKSTVEVPGFNKSIDPAYLRGGFHARTLEDVVSVGEAAGRSLTYASSLSMILLHLQ